MPALRRPHRLHIHELANAMRAQLAAEAGMFGAASAASWKRDFIYAAARPIVRKVPRKRWILRFLPSTAGSDAQPLRPTSARILPESGRRDCRAGASPARHAIRGSNSTLPTPDLPTCVPCAGFTVTPPTPSSHSRTRECRTRRARGRSRSAWCRRRGRAGRRRPWR